MCIFEGVLGSRKGEEGVIREEGEGGEGRGWGNVKRRREREEISQERRPIGKDVGNEVMGVLLLRSQGRRRRGSGEVVV